MEAFRIGAKYVESNLEPRNLEPVNGYQISLTSEVTFFSFTI
jgi:hypothetical protein